MRFFGGIGLSGIVLGSEDGLKQACERGVPLGGDLSRPSTSDTAPTSIVHAHKEEDGANLDRIQIIKGWIDRAGEQQSAIHDFPVSDDRKPGADGKIPPVGNTVNEAAAIRTNTIRDVELSVSWTDPALDASVPASYLARVIQIPTPRWSTCDAGRNEDPERPADVPVSIQERAWTSPIWYSP